MDQFNSFFTIMVLGCSAYCLYQAIYLYVTGRPPHNCILFARDRPLSDCLDEEEFFSYMKPRFLIFSLVTVISLTISMINDLTGFLSGLIAGLSPNVQFFILQLFTFLLPMAAVIWFIVCLIKIQKRLW